MTTIINSINNIMSKTLSKSSRKIVLYLQGNSSIELSISELARRCELGSAGVGQRIKDLESFGVLQTRNEGKQYHKKLVKLTDFGRSIYIADTQNA